MAPMSRRLSTVSLFCIILSLIVDDAAAQDVQFSCEANVILNSSVVIKTISTTAYTRCAIECLMNPVCTSFSFVNNGPLFDCSLSTFVPQAEVLQGATTCTTNPLRPGIKECLSSPCQNGGSCVNPPGFYTCTCSSGFTGVNCETDINECASSPCQHGGSSCSDKVNGYNCSCGAGYTGTSCQTNINECASSPCQYGGSCTDKVNGYTCTCKAGYTGTTCQTDINECSSSPCQYGGSCTDKVNGYTCACTAGYTGSNCQSNINECASTPCLHGGVCTDKVNGYTCTCTASYTGTTCQTALRSLIGPSASSGIPDSALTASSIYSGYTAAKSRLNSAASWCSASQKTGDWLQADLGSSRYVYYIETQGLNQAAWQNCWVTQYYVTYGTGTTLTEYQQSGVRKVFSGNSNANTVVTNAFSPPLTTRYVRVYVVAYPYWPSIRWDLVGY